MRGVLLFLLLSGVLSAQTRKITLEEAIDLALKNNPRVDAARLNALATGQIPTQVRSALFPQIDGGFTGVGSPTRTNIGIGTLQAPGIEPRIGIGTSVSQLLTDFGRTNQLVKGAIARSHAAEQVARASRNEIILQVTQAYLSALRAELIAQVASETVNARRTILEKVQALASSQLKSDLDVKFAAVSVTEAELILTTAQNERKAADADLAMALGLESPQEFDLTASPTVVDLALSPEELIREAVRKNPESEQKRYILDAALRQAEAEARLRYPTITALGVAGLIPAHAPQLARDQYIAGGINVTLPLFTGKRIEARRTEAEYRVKAAQRTLKETENKVARNVAVTLVNIGTARERVKLTASLIEHAKEALDLAQIRYDLGLSSIVELTQAQLAHVNAEIQRATNEYDLELQRAVLDFHIGATQ